MKIEYASVDDLIPYPNNAKIHTVEQIEQIKREKRAHPTQKPIGMLADILKDFSQGNDSIFDCFGGSGSTLIACEQLNRKCYLLRCNYNQMGKLYREKGGEAEWLTNKT